MERITGAQRARATAALSAARAFLSAFALIALVLGVALSVVLSRLVARPPTAMRAQMEEIAGGGESWDLTRRVDEERGDEIGALGRTFNRLISEIQSTSRSVTDSAADLSGIARRMAFSSGQAGQGVSGIAAAMEQVAGGASVQSSATQDVTAAVGQITGGTARAAEAGRKVAMAAEEADRSASRGASALGEENAAAAQEVSAAALETRTAVGEVDGSVGEIARAAENLGVLVGRFTV